jgi:hypothetical protein
MNFKSPTFLAFLYELMNAENSLKVGFSKEDGLWFPHPSLEGGTDTIAFGHKITFAEQDDEVYAEGINYPEAVTLLLNDLETKWIDIGNGWNNTKKQSEPLFSELEEEYQCVLVDLCFNVGLGGIVKGGKFKWPKLKQAILEDNPQEVYEQSVRTYKDRAGKRIYLWNRSTKICQAVGLPITPKG